MDTQRLLEGKQDLHMNDLQSDFIELKKYAKTTNGSAEVTQVVDAFSPRLTKIKKN